MCKSWLVCALLGTLAWGQAPPGAPAPPARAEAPADTSASVPPEAAVLTIVGVCPAAATHTTAEKHTASAKTSPASAKAADSCKTVITRAQFEKLANGLAPNMTPQLKRQLVSVLPRLMALAQAAEKQGLENTPQFKETMKFARMQILTNELQRKIQTEASNVPDSEIDAYYKKNPEAFEQYNVDRLFVPRMKQIEAEKEPGNETKENEQEKEQDQKERQAKEEQGEQEMTKLAESLQARAAAGEDFMKLQKEAFATAGMKIDSPTVNLPKVRRTGLPPGHAAIFDLKPGQVSQVINDAGGHYIYKMISEEELPLDQVKSEIHNTLQSQRMRDAMDKYQNSYKVEPNEAYFGPAGPGAMPMAPHALQRPHLAAPPTASAPKSN